jgi:hypothetical protein
MAKITGSSYFITPVVMAGKQMNFHNPSCYGRQTDECHLKEINLIIFHNPSCYGRQTDECHLKEINLKDSVTVKIKSDITACNFLQLYYLKCMLTSVNRILG